MRIGSASLPYLSITIFACSGDGVKALHFRNIPVYLFKCLVQVIILIELINAEVFESLCALVLEMQ